MTRNLRRLVIVDRHELFEDLLRALAQRGIGVCADADAERAEPEGGELVVSELAADDVAQLGAGADETLIVVGPDDEEAATAALAAGATAYFAGSTPPAQLADGVLASLRRK